jgi:hypothetical protein
MALFADAFDALSSLQQTLDSAREAVGSHPVQAAAVVTRQ